MPCPFHDTEFIPSTPHALQSAPGCIIYVCTSGHVFEMVSGTPLLIHECHR